MKYYTKEWYELMQGPGKFFGRLPDAEYSDADVEMLYKKKLKKAIADAKKDYNTEPFLEYLLTENASKSISRFDEVMPDYRWISPVKKVDFYLWSIR